MTNYKRILVAVDFSEISEHAAQRAVELARWHQAELMFIHVIEHFPRHLPHYKMSGEDMDPEEFLIDRADKDLQNLCHRLNVDDAEKIVRLTKHSAKVEILEVAQAKEVELIVLGSQGHHRLSEMIAGSTATGIVRSAKCDVYTVRGIN